MHCCGMSMTINKKRTLNSFLIRCKPISDNNFYLLLACILICSLLNEILINICYKYEKKNANYLVIISGSIFTFFISWSLMMLSMTSNIWVLIAMIFGKIIGKFICLKKIGTSKAKCCV